MDLVCDTNIWYRIEEGEICPDDLKKMGHRLLALPFSISELISKLNSKYFEQRKRVAQTIIDHADEILPDVEHHLASIWQVRHPTETNDWYQIIKSLADASDLDSLETGVIDLDNQKIAKIAITKATELRTDRDDDYIRSIEEQNELFIPGYTDARKEKTAMFLKKGKEEYSEMMQSSFIEDLILKTTYSCALQILDNKDVDIPSESVKDARFKLTPYIKVSQFYMEETVIKKTAEANDRGDLKLFIYAQDGRRVFTKEIRWNRLAKEAGLEEFIFELPASLSGKV